MSKPREFWIKIYSSSLLQKVTQRFRWDRCPVTNYEFDGSLHVIEKSAYDQLKAENEAYKQTLEKIERGVGMGYLQTIDCGRLAYQVLGDRKKVGES